MSCRVRLMRQEDVAQVTEIDREAFATMWPPTDYRRELRNRLGHYLAAYDDEKTVEPPEPKAVPEKGLSGLVFRLRSILGGDRFFSRELPPSGSQYIIGFAGFWIMAEEAHIVNVAVRQSYRRRGMGELLLIALIDLAVELNTRLMTLEVRASNTAARRLYGKYGFVEQGLRRGYYLDNREDAVIMSVENVISAVFQARLDQLKQAHSRRWGIPLYQITR